MKYIAIILTILFSSSDALFAQEDIAEGKTIFKSRCTSCHALDRQVIGPALKGVNSRHEEKWIVNFVHSSQTVIKGGDENAMKLFEEYNQTIMPDHKDLSEAQIKNILAYIKNEGEKKPEASSTYTPVFNKPYNNKNSIIEKIVYLNSDEAQEPIKFGDTFSWLLIAGIIFLLIGLFYLITYLNCIAEMVSNKNGWLSLRENQMERGIEK